MREFIRSRGSDGFWEMREYFENLSKQLRSKVGKFEREDFKVEMATVCVGVFARLALTLPSDRAAPLPAHRACLSSLSFPSARGQEAVLEGGYCPFEARYLDSIVDLVDTRRLRLIDYHEFVNLVRPSAYPPVATFARGSVCLVSGGASAVRGRSRPSPHPRASSSPLRRSVARRRTCVWPPSRTSSRAWTPATSRRPTPRARCPSTTSSGPSTARSTRSRCNGTTRLPRYAFPRAHIRTRTS